MSNTVHLYPSAAEDLEFEFYGFWILGEQPQVLVIEF